MLCTSVDRGPNMTDLATSLSTAFGILKRLKDINENIKNSEFSNLIADLSMELAEVKMRLAGVIEENVKLKEQIRELQNVEGDPCPRCRKRGWHVEDSK